MQTMARLMKKPDCEEHPHEDALHKLVGSAPCSDPRVIKEARKIGIPWQAIVAAMIQYGPGFIEFIQTVVEAFKAEPPKPIVFGAAEDKQICPPQAKPKDAGSTA